MPRFSGTRSDHPMIEKRTALSIAAILLLGLLSFSAYSSEEVELAKVVIPTSAEARRRGAQTVTSVCMMCHNLKYMRYRNLLELGFTEEEVIALRDEPDLDAAMHSDLDHETKMQMFAMIPPDMSLLAKAREGRGRYIYSFVTGFEKIENGKIDNHIFPNAKMPDVMDIASAGPEERKEIQAKILDVAAFLEWAADPRAKERIRLGYFVIAYLVVLTLLLYLVKRKIWSRIKPSD